MNLYVSLSQFKGTGVLDATGTANDTRLLQVLDDVSRQVEGYCGRRFYALVETRHFSGDGGQALRVPDLISIGTLLEDNNDDGTAELAWAAADYHLWPWNAAPTSEWGGPYTQVRVAQNSAGTQDAFLRGQRNYQIDGTWGYSLATADTGATGTLADATGTALPVSLMGTFSVGQTVRIGTESLYITSTGAGGTGAGTLSVRRGANGSTAAAATGTGHVVYDIVYPGPVVEAVIVQAARLWKRKDSAFAATVGMPETGQMLTWRGGLDADVKALLNAGRLKRTVI